MLENVEKYFLKPRMTPWDDFIFFLSFDPKIDAKD